MLTDEELISGLSMERLSACIRRGQRARQSGGSPEMLPILILDSEACRAHSYANSSDPASYRPIPARIRLGVGQPFQHLEGALTRTVPISPTGSDREKLSSPFTEDSPSPGGMDHLQDVQADLQTQESLAESSGWVGFLNNAVLTLGLRLCDSSHPR